MLEVLQRVVQEVNAARDLDEVLAIIVRQIKQVMAVDVASVYLTDFEQNEHVLMTSDGLNPEAIGVVRMQQNEGLVGLAARRAEPVNIADASTHPNFKSIPETGENRYSAFLGVPVIHQRKVLGVLVVQRKQKQVFDEENVAFLVTLAAQLAGSIAHAEARGQGSSIAQILPTTGERFISAVPGAPGVGVGTAVVIFPIADLHALPDRKIDDIENEIRIFKTALSEVKKDLRNMKRRLSSRMPAESQALFDAYTLLVKSDTLLKGTLAKIREGNWAAGSLRDVIQSQARKFEEMEDEYLRERADDIREIGQRILQKLQETTQGKRDYPKRAILVGAAIGATDLADAPIKQIAGVVSTRGSSSSHVAILARAMGIPAVMGADDLSITQLDGRELVLDGYQGRIYIEPSSLVRREYSRLAREETQLIRELKTLSDLPSETPDGIRIPLYVNTGLMADITPSLKSGAEGVGLYRTEFPFMIRDRFPGEEEQREIYRHTLKAFAPRPVTLRTLDVGGDKALPYFPIQEENPFLGWRGIRITLDHREIFLTQLRAMLRASAGLDNLNILLPMISDVSELDEAIMLIDQAFDEVDEEGEDVSWPKIGVMIEVPSAVYQAEQLAQRVDFLSIGTNDLTQYLLAVDRNNARVAKLYNTLHPAVLKAIMQVVEAAHKYGRPVSVCGEMAGDPAAAILLLGMGVDSLSMTVASLHRVKWVIRSISQRTARLLLTRALQMEVAQDIRKLLNGALEDAGLGGLVRAGK